MGGASPPRSWASTRAPQYPTFPHFATRPRTGVPFATSIAGDRVPAMSAPEAMSAAPDDANDLRGYYFRLLLGKTGIRVAIALAAIVGAVAGTLLAGPAIGAAGLAAALVVALLIVFGIADSRSEDAFFDVYGQQHGMSVHGRSRLPQATPLLRKGDDRYAERMLEGPLADGVDGVLALYTYEDETTDSEGNRQTELLPLHGRPRRAARVRRLRPRALLPAQVRAARAGEVRGRLPPLQRTGQAGERGARRALRDLRRQGRGRQPPAPALLPHLHRLADRLGAREVRLRAGRRDPLLLCQGPQEEGGRARHDPRRLSLRGSPPARGVGRVTQSGQKPLSRTSALAMRAAAIISRTEGTRSRATTSWILGAARAARSSTARRWSRRSAAA